jgi:hypothetical protein
MDGICTKIKMITVPRSRLKLPIGVLVAELNPVLRAFGNYFGQGNSTRKFSQIDEYVRERLALFDSKKRGQGRTVLGQTRLRLDCRAARVRHLGDGPLPRNATATT